MNSHLRLPIGVPIGLPPAHFHGVLPSRLFIPALHQCPPQVCCFSMSTTISASSGLLIWWTCKSLLILPISSTFTSTHQHFLLALPPKHTTHWSSWFCLKMAENSGQEQGPELPQFKSFGPYLSLSFLSRIQDNHDHSQWFSSRPHQLSVAHTVAIEC